MKKCKRKLESILHMIIIKKATYQNLPNAAKAVLRGRFLITNVYIGKEKRQKNQWSMCPLEELRKEKEINSEKSTSK